MIKTKDHLISQRVDIPQETVDLIDAVKVITGIQKRKIIEFAINEYCNRIIRKDSKK